MPEDTNKKTGRSLLSDTWTGYSIILVHIVFVIGLATAIIFIQALADYIEYVIAGGGLLILASCLFFYRKFRKNGRQLVQTLRQTSARYNQDIKIDLLGGLASISINNHDHKPHPPLVSPGEVEGAGLLQALPSSPPEEETKTKGESQHELLRLAELFDRQLINKEEFDIFKKGLLAAGDENQTGPSAD